ncbi:Septin-9 [Armadillidium vulgare]|nr:Septin-9 [Armadillidium vulgare]
MECRRSGLGKSTLVKTLFKNGAIRSVCCDLFEKGVKLSLTVTDTPGFGDQLGTSCGIYRKTVPVVLGRRKKTAKKIPAEGHQNPLLSLFYSTKWSCIKFTRHRSHEKTLFYCKCHSCNSQSRYTHQ